MNSKEIPFTKEEQRALLQYARQCVEAYVRQQPLPTLEDPRFQEIGTVFVTIHRHGDLRGCIGRFAWDQPLTKSIQEMAIHAATQDPRFMPVTPDELDSLTYEISILSPPQKLQKIEDIQIGTHGLIISQGYNRGVLLPQVASEYGWNVQQFLENTCQKARLPKNCWQDPHCEIQTFTAWVFSEESLEKED